MMIETAVIQVNCPHHRLPCIADKRLGMDKAQGVLVNFHTRCNKRGVMGFGQRIGNPFVRNPRQDQRHLHASLRRKLERRLHLPVQNQVGSHNVNILNGTV